MKKGTLRQLLSALVDDCGYSAVRKALEDLEGAPASRDAPVKRPKKPRAKPNAIAIVESLTLPDEEKKMFLVLNLLNPGNRLYPPYSNIWRIRRCRSYGNLIPGDYTALQNRFPPSPWRLKTSDNKTTFDFF